VTLEINTRLLRNNQANMQICRFIMFNVAFSMFRPPILAIFREVFFGGTLHRTLKQLKVENVKF